MTLKILNTIRSRFTDVILSVPIHLKILGMVWIVAALFGAITLYQTQKNASQILYQDLIRTGNHIAFSLAFQIEKPLVTNDLFSLQHLISETKDNISDVRYIIVHNKEGEVVAHSFPASVPDDLLKRISKNNTRKDKNSLILKSSEELVFEITHPILDGHAGTLKVGLSDKRISSSLTSITKSFLITLLICMVIGQILALLLTHVLTLPLNHLLLMTTRVKEGDFQTRARVFSSDEFGKLSATFNQMTEGLGKYKKEVIDKENIRQSLLKKIINIQEDERMSIARELHDSRGQSLSTLLLTIQSAKKENTINETVANECEKKIHQLIDDVRHLAWRLRPSILDDYGLDATLVRYIEEIKTLTNMSIDYKYIAFSQSSRLPPHIEITLYRIAQEAVTNILHHANANQISIILLNHNANEIILLIEDNGLGFDAKNIWSNKDKSLGLIGMNERAKLIGGEFSVESSLGKGTAVKVKIPVLPK